MKPKLHMIDDYTQEGVQTYFVRKLNSEGKPWNFYHVDTAWVAVRGFVAGRMTVDRADTNTVINELIHMLTEHNTLEGRRAIKVELDILLKKVGG